MTITQVITALPAAPNPATDTPTVFSEKAAAFVAAQQVMVPELNTFRTQANALETNVNAKESSASGYATAALGYRDTAQFAADAAVGYRDQAQGWAAAAAASANTIGTTAAFSDANPMVKNATVNTKQGRFIASGISTSTTRDYLLPDRNGTMALTTDTGLALVGGPLILTASANVDFLTLFSSLGNAFDNYTIFINRPQPNVAAASDILALRFAVGGVVDTSNVYATFSTGSSGGTSNPYVGGISIRGTDSSAGVVRIDLQNVNSAPSLKVVLFEGTTGINGTSVANYSSVGAYAGNNVVSGFRLYWLSGSNFVAGGTIRVYGWKNQ